MRRDLLGAAFGAAVALLAVSGLSMAGCVTETRAAGAAGAISSSAVAADGTNVEWWVEGDGAAPSFTPIEVVGTDMFDAEVLKSAEPVLVDFSKHGCAACRRLAPILGSMQEDYVGRLKLVRVEVLATPALIRVYRIRATPTVVFFRDGAEVLRAVNPRSREDLVAMTDKVLAGGTPNAP